MQVDMNELLSVMRKAFELPDWYEFTEDSSMERCDRWDSLSHLRMILAVEDHFKFRFPDRMNQYVSVKSIYQALITEGAQYSDFMKED